MINHNLLLKQLHKHKLIQSTNPEKIIITHEFAQQMVKNMENPSIRWSETDVGMPIILSVMHFFPNGLTKYWIHKYASAMDSIFITTFVKNRKRGK